MKRGWVIAIVVLAVLIVAGVVFMSITQWRWAWTGVVGYSVPRVYDQDYVRGKTLWDLLELLIVPAALAVIAWWFSNRERKDDRDAADKRAEFDRIAADNRAQVEREVANKRAETEREIAADRLREAALQGYYDKMTELLLKENLRDAAEGEEVISIAKSRTLATLRSLDGTRKGLLIKFLYETHLIDRIRIIIHLDGADLKDADLFYAKLSNINLANAMMEGSHLKRVDMSGADLSGANLLGVDLSVADLRAANLRGAHLSEANLSNADLRATNLSGANLRRAILSRANLVEADLRAAILDSVKLSGAELIVAQMSMATLMGADLSEADLSGADLSGAFLWKADLSRANLSGAHLREADLRAAILDRINLSGANLSGAHLSEADLRAANLSGVEEVSAEQLAQVKTLFGAKMMDGNIYDPAIHTEIAKLRMEAGLDDGNTPTEGEETSPPTPLP